MQNSTFTMQDWHSWHVPPLCILPYSKVSLFPSLTWKGLGRGFWYSVRNLGKWFQIFLTSGELCRSLKSPLPEMVFFVQYNSTLQRYFQSLNFSSSLREINEEIKKRSLKFCIPDLMNVSMFHYCQKSYLNTFKHRWILTSNNRIFWYIFWCQFNFT